MSYIKISWPDSQKYTSLPEGILENLEADDVIIFGEEAGDILIDEDEIESLDELVEMYDGAEDEDSFELPELPENIKEDIRSLADKYSKKNGYDGDINLKKEIYLPSRESNVIAFYVYQNWIYLLDDEGADIDPNDVEIEFLEKFTDYIADERNTYTED